MQDRIKVDFRKSSHSNQSGCVEVAETEAGDRLVRDSEHRDGPVLRFNLEKWDAFIKGAQDHEFDV